LPDYDTLRSHDCQTIRPFTLKKEKRGKILPEVMPEWISQGRKWSGVKDFVKYNWAYGIPILGTEDFTDESMKRACYLVRYMWAGNEQFRRFTYKSQMYLKGGTGGTCCMPTVGNAGHSCPCDAHKGSSFPVKQIVTSAHEMAHWYIKRVLPRMQAAGVLKLPVFQNTTEWSWQKPNDCFPDEKLADWDPVREFLWNSAFQDKSMGNTNADQCKWHHYFIYTGQDKHLSQPCGGECKKKTRADQKLRNPNLYNLMESLWQCDNDYISVCEDSAFDFKKGAAQQFRIGKSDPEDPSKMICMPIDHDTAEIEVSEVPEHPHDIPEEDVFKPTEEYNVDHCMRVLYRGGWLEANSNNYGLNFGEVAQDLPDSNEQAWWLRKCCARTAKFLVETEDEKVERLAYETEVKRKLDLAEANEFLEVSKTEAIEANQKLQEAKNAVNEATMVANKIEAAEQAIERLNEKKRDAEEQAEQGKIDVEEKEAKKIQKTADVETAKTELKEASDALEGLRKNNPSLQEALEALEALRKNNPSRKELRVAEKAYKGLQKDHEDAEEAVEDAKTAVEDAETKEANAIQALADKIEKVTEDNDKKDVAVAEKEEAAKTAQAEADEALAHASEQAITAGQSEAERQRLQEIEDELRSIAEEKIEARREAQNLVDQLVEAKSEWAKEQIRLEAERKEQHKAEVKAKMDAAAAEAEAAAAAAEAEAEAEADGGVEDPITE